MDADQELMHRAAEAWKRHSAEPRISGGPDGLRREFVAGYCAREADLGESAPATPVQGDRVLYRLTAYDATLINSWRGNFELAQAAADHRHPHEAGGSGASGHIAHIGAPVAEGDTLFADVSLVPDPGSGRLCLRVATEGNDVYRVTGAAQGDGPGTWSRRPAT